MTESQAGDIIFYDGGCALCHSCVRFALKHDSEHYYSFAPIGGETYQQLDLPPKAEQWKSVVLYKHGSKTLLFRSDAILEILTHLFPKFRIIWQIAQALPRVIRDGVYRIVAVTRYQIFGRAEQSCPVPLDSERARLLP